MKIDMIKYILTLIFLIFANISYAFCPEKEDNYIKFKGIFDASHCKYEEFRSFNCYPIIILNKPVIVKGTELTKVELQYDNAAKNNYIKPLVKLGKPTKVSGCGILINIKYEAQIEVWEILREKTL